jgi:hypothetical protein
MAYTLISTTTIASSGTTSVFTLSSIPSTYTDLLIVGSIRTSRANSDPGADFQMTFNSSAVSYARRSLEGTGSSTGSTTGGSTYIDGLLNDSSFATANTFGSWQIYIPNYASTTTNKTVSIETVTETNAAQSFARLVAGSWANTAAITRIDLTDGNSATFMAGSTISLYGIN